MFQLPQGIKNLELFVLQMLRHLIYKKEKNGFNLRLVLDHLLFSKKNK